MIIYVSGRRYRRRVPFYRSWVASWIIPAAIITAVLFAIWPLLAFRHHWVTVVQVPCWQDPGLPGCANVPFGDVLATAPRVVAHSAPTALGAWLTVAWLGFWLALVMTGAVLGRSRQCP